MIARPPPSIGEPFFCARPDRSINSVYFLPRIVVVPKAWTVLIDPMTSSARVPPLATASSDTFATFFITTNMSAPKIMITGRIELRARASRHDRA
jgi:hypothetical protein